jgi:chaperonin GroES
MQLPEEANFLENSEYPNEIIEIPLEDQEVLPPAPQGPQLPIEETNLAEDLEEDELQEIANDVIKNYKDDLTSRSDWEEKNADYLRLFYQSDMAENPPWDGSSNESIPLLTEAVNQFQSRTYKAFFPNRYFVEAIPVGKSSQDARERGERIAAHMNFQLGVVDRTYKRNKNQMFMACGLHGSDFTKTYFDHMKRRVVIERVRAQDLVVPYHVGQISIEELERKTHVKFVSVNNTKILHKMGYFISPAEPYTGHEDIGEAQEVVDEQQGVSDSDISSESTKGALILEQHCLLDLDEDGISEPYIVWVDAQARKTLRIQVRYEVDEMGNPTKGKEPIEHFTHYQFLPNPDGFYGFGFGFLLAKINFALNKLTRMFIDAGELSTVGNLTYLISDALGIPGDDFQLVMGKGIKIPRNVADIQKHFMKLDFRGPDPAIQQAIEYLQGVAQRVANNSDILAGQPDKVYQPQALLSMLEQGLQLYSSVQEFMAVSMEEELHKVFRLNAKYMQSEEYFFDGDQQITVTREDYQDDFRIVPIFDPKYATRSQKLAKAQAEVDFVLQFPLTAQNPKSLYLAGRRYLEALDVENIDEVLPQPSVPEPARIDDQNLENAYYIMPPDKRPLFDVFPDQDHVKHIQMIDKFISSFLDQGEAMEIPLEGEDPKKPSVLGQDNKVGKLGTGGDPGIKRLVQSMSSEQKEELISNLLRHRAQHLGVFFGQINGVLDEHGNPIQPNSPVAGQGPNGPVAAEPSNSGDMELLMQALQSPYGTA